MSSGSVELSRRQEGLETSGQVAAVMHCDFVTVLLVPGLFGVSGRQQKVQCVPGVK